MRWTLTDPLSLDTWTMPINPDAMTSPHAVKMLTTARGTRAGTDRARTFRTPSAPVEWSWEGVIRSKEHYDTLQEWSEKDGEIHVSDHLGRTWSVVFQSYQPEDRPPTPQTPWRLRYVMTVLILRRVS